MALRCLVFSSDEGTAEPIRQVLAGLGVEGEHCSDAGAAVERVALKNFQIVIIDWDKQPEAGLMLAAARERKAAERPLTLAIVSDDASVANALQAGANSILRKPILVNQVNDTLTTARDLLRAKQESAAAVAHAAAAGASAGSSAPLPTKASQAKETSLRAEEFLEPSPSVPKAQFLTKSHAPEFVTALEPVITPKGLEPIAAPPTDEKPAAPSAAAVSPPPPGGPRGLEWYLKTRLGTSTPSRESAPTPVPSAKPELLGVGEMPSRSSESAQPKSSEPVRATIPETKANDQSAQDHKNEAELFAYMAGETGESKEVPRPKSRLGKGAIIGALALAGCAILAAPQAPWHSQMRGVWARGLQSMHGWLNPQPVTPVQAPVAHEDFGRAGDEYKMPVSETIPDATTDPSQIQVVPVVDPTAKKPNNDAANPQQPAGLPDGTATTPGEQTPASEGQVPEKQLSPLPSDPPPTLSGPTMPATSSAPGSATEPAGIAPPRSDSPSTASSTPAAAMRLAPPKNRPPRDTSSSGNVPSSLKSQIASMTPYGSGNKAPEAAMPSIEPVIVPEATERTLLTEQPALAYPGNAKGQQGTVILQVLIGRDGTVQDAKFLQGSLAFARAAIDGAKQWKFKPYTMNGRAVSVQTLLTITYKPTP
jgi:periplasmic protein TonB